MCFSATASFAVSGGLVAASAATLKTAPKRLRFVALIPLAFALQQALEGVQWLSVNAGKINLAAAYGYLAFAYVLWPVIVPAVVYRLDPQSHKYTRFFFPVGLGVALWDLHAMVTHTLQVTIADGHLAYSVGVPAYEAATLIYVFAVCGPLLTSSIYALRVFGVFILAAAITSFFGFYSGFASVWCILSAVISASVFWYVRSARARAVV